MLSVTFQAAIIIDPANLHSLLSLANTPAIVEPYAAAPVAVAAPAKRVRKTAAASTGEAKPKRTRATKAEMEARRAAAAGGAPETPKPTAAPEAGASETKASDAPSATTSAPVADKPKRDRRSAAKKAADAAKEAGKAAPKPAAKPKADPKPKTTAKGDAPDANKLLERFAALIDKDFAGAQALLGEFDVKRFSEVPVDQHAAFEAKLVELGV